MPGFFLRSTLRRRWITWMIRNRSWRVCWKVSCRNILNTATAWSWHSPPRSAVGRRRRWSSGVSNSSQHPWTGSPGTTTENSWKRPNTTQSTGSIYQISTTAIDCQKAFLHRSRSREFSSEVIFMGAKFHKEKLRNMWQSIREVGNHRICRCHNNSNSRLVFDNAQCDNGRPWPIINSTRSFPVSAKDFGWDMFFFPPN